MTLFEASPPLPRPPGWNLIATRTGTQGWHMVDRTTPDRGVVTVCGIVGRVIADPATIITPCEACASAEHP